MRERRALLPPYVGLVSSPDTLTMDGNKTVDAQFDLLPTYSLTITMSGTGSGTVEVNQSGPYNYGDVVTIWANASVGSHFVTWSGNLTGSTTPETLTITGNMNVDAQFDLDGPYTLTTTTSGTGSGTVEVNDSGPYYYGDVVTLWANASVGSSFVTWSGDLSGSTSPDTLTMDGNKTVDAEFDLDGPFTLSITTSGSGSGTIFRHPDRLDLRFWSRADRHPHPGIVCRYPHCHTTGRHGCLDGKSCDLAKTMA